VLKRGAERRKRDFRCLSASRKGEKENFSVKAWRGKVKKKILVLKRGAERQKRVFRCLSAARKGEKEIFGA